MKTAVKPIDKVTYAELAEHSVWEFMPESATHDETWVRPVTRLPVRSLGGRIVASFVRLANGRQVLAFLGNLDLRDSTKNEHFLTLSVVKPRGKRFHLARYHDVTYKSEGPKALAEFLKLPLKEVFPIEYDISGVARGEPASVKGIIPLKPKTRLTKAHLIALAVENAL